MWAEVWKKKKNHLLTAEVLERELELETFSYTDYRHDHLVYLFILTIFYATEAHFCIEVLFPPGTARWLHSTLMESKTRLVRDVFDTFATHAEFFVTSLVQTAGHKIGKFTVLLLLFSNVDI